MAVTVTDSEWDEHEYPDADGYEITAAHLLTVTSGDQPVASHAPTRWAVVSIAQQDPTIEENPSA